MIKSTLQCTYNVKKTFIKIHLNFHIGQSVVLVRPDFQRKVVVLVLLIQPAVVGGNHILKFNYIVLKIRISHGLNKVQHSIQNVFYQHQ